jgi:RNA polymerase sigma-70 factor (ECF subfamily)
VSGQDSGHWKSPADTILERTLFKKSAVAAHVREDSAEPAWVAASQQGDTLAFNRLVLKWEHSIYNLTMRMLQNPDEAAEATQEVFMSAFKNIRKFRQDAQFSTWLYRIAANHCISRLRRRPQGVQISLDDDHGDRPIVRELPAADSHEQEFFRQESRRSVLSALQHLAPEQRAVVELKFYQELTFEQIAEITQTPMSTVKSRLYSGLGMLKDLLVHAAS